VLHLLLLQPLLLQPLQVLLQHLLLLQAQVKPLLLQALQVQQPLLHRH
jgi:hypothetical protein